ncbi:hypothetical protein MUY27_05600 [Mucilaginibacter sp. RS28]|uniref:DUF4251 domain-containing protein n=1 Tax=Mucilaginibacter straminoryzae TaxID=2932774 RepID=A0A9X1X3V9_9SPHI|nr:hypothetical protein [Mucilaginibacter straminoryzae]MCJ8209173.1 hypothetical protein [Mucilaginibacter straminoryzae]
MKKVFAVLSFLMILGLSRVQAQHINFPDLLSLVSAPPEQINQFLTVGKKFEFLSTDFTSGHPISRYQNKYDGFRETVTTGMGSPNKDGRMLRVISYTTTSLKHINEILTQITKYGYPLCFKGADDTKNIRVYQSDLYSVSVYIPFNQSFFTVEVHERQFITIESP